jgi:hypothetical protein
MAADDKLPDPQATRAVIGHLRGEAHLLRNRLKEAYGKIAVIEHAEQSAKRHVGDTEHKGARDRPGAKVDMLIVFRA